MGLTKRLHEPKAMSLGSLLDRASGCSTPCGWKPQMHRAYQPVLPCGNKYLQLKWDKAKYEEHKKKIQAAKPLVDTSTPATYGHLHLKLGKLKLEEDRLSGIERDNRMLLKKMSCIMRTKGQIDNKNDYKAKSLNREKRKKELLRVSQENRAILDRITKSEPQYQVQRWYEDWQQAEKYMANIARYPRGQCKAHSQKEEPFKKQVSKQDRKREKQLKEKSMKRKMKGVHHGKGRDQLEQDSTPEMAHFPQSPVKVNNQYLNKHVNHVLEFVRLQEDTT